jgi:hypothetical protein
MTVVVIRNSSIFYFQTIFVYFCGVFAEIQRNRKNVKKKSAAYIYKYYKKWYQQHNNKKYSRKWTEKLIFVVRHSICGDWSETIEQGIQ